jgi:predicted nucleic acid-binding protein
VKKRLYFDTSTVIKEFAPEVGSELIDKLTTKAREGDIQIVSSVWMINEALAELIGSLERMNLNNLKFRKSLQPLQNV